MDATASLKRLLAVLTERDIGLGYDDLAWLFESPQTRDAMISWVHEHLTSATLLTPEELDIHAYIAQSNYKHDTKDSTPRPLEENDFETAIHALEASTDAIEKQSAIMEAQRDALAKLQTLNREPVLDVSESDQKRSSQARTKAQLDLETNELTDLIQQRVDTTTRWADSSLALLKSSAQRQLDKDDRLLDGLQKVMVKLAPLDSSEKHMPDFNTLARALVKLESNIIKDQTNVTYLESLKQLEGESDNMEHQSNAQAAQEAFALSEELEILLTEVDSVLEMVVNKQYRAPIVTALKQSDTLARLQQKSWLDYIKTALSGLAQKTQDLAAYTQDALAYASAVNHVSDAFTETLPPPAQPPPRLSRNQSTRGPSPMKALNPILHRQVSQSTKDPALEMLGYHGIRIPVDAGTNVDAVSSALQSAVLERQSHLHDLEKSTERSVAAQVADSVNMADGELQNLLGVLYAYSPYSTVNLMDGRSKKRLEHLDHELASLGEGIRKLDLNRLAEAEHERLLVAFGELEHQADA